MSSIRQILALIDDDPRCDAVLALGARLAGSHGAGLSAMHVVRPLTSGVAAYMSPGTSGLAISYAAKADDERRQLAAARVASASERHGREIPFAAAAA
ncbi:MAG: universal stress protein, partial [Rubrivivax sp.]|nr:universal stress protein [Rubrivivax sp.]